MHPHVCWDASVRKTSSKNSKNNEDIVYCTECNEAFVSTCHNMSELQMFADFYLNLNLNADKPLNIKLMLQPLREQFKSEYI